MPDGDPQRVPTSGVVSPTFTDTYLRVRAAVSIPVGRLEDWTWRCAATAG